MRPSSSETTHAGLVDGRSRKSSIAGQQQHQVTAGISGLNTPGEEHGYPMHSSSTSSMTYFLADEATVAASVASGASSSNFGVRSLGASIEDPDLRYRKRLSLAEYSRRSFEENDQEVKDEEDEEEEEDGDEDEEDDHGLDGRSVASFQSSAHPDLRSLPGLLSEPLTPIMGPQSDPSHSPRSPSGGSYRSEEDARSDQAASSPPKRPGLVATKAFSQEPSGAPQLIMPEITIPSRRPFTDKGKRIGRLKMLIAGDSGRALLCSLRSCTGSKGSC